MQACVANAVFDTDQCKCIAGRHADNNICKQNVYTLAFDSNGGGTPPGNISCTFEEPCMFPTMTRTGYTFGGWIIRTGATCPASGVEYHTDDIFDPTPPPAHNTTITMCARWVACLPGTYAYGSGCAPCTKDYYCDGNGTQKKCPMGATTTLRKPSGSATSKSDCCGPVVTDSVGTLALPADMCF
ncbi:MAG: InlB B-repeat-containing protein [Alphaproteobacteria bacterium]|nr:InlB B-repeat-containing protein [Alphaproteobacteria bacterium]